MTDSRKKINNSRAEKKESAKNKTVNNHPIITKILLRIVTILMITCILFTAAYYGRKSLKSAKLTKTHAMVDRQLSYCQEFVTAKYKYSDIVTLKKSIGFSKSYSIVKYSGVLRVGIADFTDISYSISRDGKKIHIRLPFAEVLGNELVNQEVFDEKQSIFVPITTQEIFDEIQEAQKDAQEEMINEGVLNEARVYAEKIIRQFMLSCGFEEVILD